MTSKRIDENDATWQADAFKAMAQLMELYAVRSTLEAKIDEAKRACARAGCQFRYNGDLPELVRDGRAYRCACGSVFGFEYGDTVPPNPVCSECREKTRAAVEQDTKAEQVVTGPQAPEPAL